jgi:hypothetical protein
VATITEGVYRISLVSSGYGDQFLTAGDEGDRPDPGEINRPSALVVSGVLCGEVDLGLSRAAIVGEARIPAAEAAGQVGC